MVTQQLLMLLWLKGPYGEPLAGTSTRVLLCLPVTPLPGLGATIQNIDLFSESYLKPVTCQTKRKPEKKASPLQDWLSTQGLVYRLESDKAVSPSPRQEPENWSWISDAASIQLIIIP